MQEENLIFYKGTDRESYIGDSKATRREIDGIMKKKTSPELKLLELWSKHIPETLKITNTAAAKAKKATYSQQDARASLNISSTPQDIGKSGSKIRDSKARQQQESKNSLSNSINNSKSPSNNKVSYVIQVII